ncbi:hypothetical protein LCGC14_2432460, partial [marine sediment metagenome]
MNRQTSHHQPCLEALEPRVLLSAAMHGGTLKVRGDDDPAGPDDQIVLRLNSADPSVFEAVVNGEVVHSAPLADLRAVKIFAGLGDDTVQIDLGAAGADIPVRIFGGPGDDTLTGGDADDKLLGGRGNDELSGGDGDDRLRGGRGDDVLNGGDGNDRVRGGPGDDVLKGGQGQDWLFGGRGKDWLYALPSDDRFRVSRRDLLIVDDQVDGSDQSLAELKRIGLDEEFKQWIIDAGAEQWRDLFGTVQAYKGGWYRDDLGGPMILGATLAGDTVMSAATGAEDHSGTNTQEQGVDEADLVKTDGEYLYVLSGNDLIIADAWPADELDIVSRTPIEGTVLSMYLYGDRVTVLSRSDWNVVLDDPIQIMPAVGEAPAFVAVDSLIWPPVYQEPELTVTVLDVADRANPALVEETTVEGSLISSRSIDGRVHLVMRNNFWLLRPLAEKDPD